MQERDLDLMILEELHSDTRFSDWLVEQLGLEGFVFADATHSVSAKAGAKWGETDVLAFFSRNNERIALLIEDKIDASFTDRQAQRYHERAQEIVHEGQADRYVTLLIAPKVYLAGVPADDPWDHRLAIDDIVAWFENREDSHARWRADALGRCLKRLQSNISAGRDDVRRFSNEFAGFLAANYPEFSHGTTGNSWGLVVDFSDRPKGVQLVWKPNQSAADLELYSPHVGKLANLPEQVGLIRRLSSDGEIKSDSLRAPLGTAVWSESLSSQMEVVEEVIAVFQRLRLLAIEIIKLPSVVEEAPQLP
jgi:hypothetical protein